MAVILTSPKEFQNLDVGVKTGIFFFSNREVRHWVPENVFVKKLERNWEVGILFFWCGKWSFDSGIPLVMKVTSKMVVLKNLYLTDFDCGCWIFVVFKQRWRWFFFFFFSFFAGNHCGIPKTGGRILTKQTALMASAIFGIRWICVCLFRFGRRLVFDGSKKEDPLFINVKVEFSVSNVGQCMRCRPRGSCW